MSKELTIYNWHEALDRSGLVLDIFEEYVTPLAVIKNNKDIRKKAVLASEALYDLYQLIGAKYPNLKEMI